MHDAIIAVCLTLLAIVGTTIFHLEALNMVTRFARGPRHARVLVPGVVMLVVSAHLIEIAAYTVIYWLADVPLDIGSFTVERPRLSDMFYFAAETYSSLGFDDILPHGALRLIVAIGSINGILLLAWSGAFLFDFAHGMSSDRFR